MKKSQILALFAIIALLSSFIPASAQTQRVQNLIDSGKQTSRINGKIQSFMDKTNPLVSKFTERMKRNPSVEENQGGGCAEYLVNNTNDSGPGSLRDAIDSAPDDIPCTIKITVSGTVNLLSPLVIENKDLDIIFQTNDISSVTDQNGYDAMTPDLFVVNASTIDSNFNVRSGVLIISSEVVMTGFTFTGGAGTDFKTPRRGGGIYALDSSVLVSAMTIRGNSATQGAGIYAEKSTFIVTQSTVSGNTATPDGYSSAVPAGGGIYLDSGSCADGSTCGALLITLSTVTGNSAEIGGGIFFEGINNDPSNGDTQIGLINGSTVSGNSATDEAGGIALNYSYPSVDSAPQGDNGGVRTVSLISSIVAGNTVSGEIEEEGPDVAELNDALLTNESPFNLVGIYDGPSLSADINIIGTSASPVNPQLETLSDNGGPTKTVALLNNSPAIDSGLYFPFVVFGSGDQRYQERPVIFNNGVGNSDSTMVEGEGSDGSDIGAYELQIPDEPSCDLSEAVTYSQGGWSSTARNKPLTDEFFNDNFGSSLVLGSVSNNRSVTLTSATAVTRFLPNSGTAAILKNGNLTNPTNRQVKNVLAGQTAAAMLNFARNPSFGDAELATGMGIPFEGTSIGQIIDMGNNALGNVSGPYSKTYLANLAKALEYVNLSFHGGTNQGFVVCSEGSGPSAR